MRPVGHIRQRSCGSWELRYSIGRSSETGRRRVATVTVRGTRKDAERELRRLLRTQDTGEHVDPTRMTAAQWLNQWLGLIRDSVSGKTYERYAELANNFLIPEFGQVRLSRLTPAQIQASYAKWSMEGRRDGKPGGLSPLTRRHIHRVLRSALTRAVELQIIARNPSDPLRKTLPKVERREMKTLSDDQTNSLLGILSDSRLYWPCLIAVAAGMRRGEILALRWKHVDFDQETVRVVESLEQTKKTLRFKTPKTDRFRSIVLPSYAVRELKRLKKEQAEALLALGVRQTGETLVCGRADGEPHQPRSLTHEFAAFMASRKDLPRIRFHDLRHTHATQLLSAGVHPKVAQERLGHSTVTTTMDLYSHVMPTLQSEAAQRLDEAFQRAKTAASTAT